MSNQNHDTSGKFARKNKAKWFLILPIIAFTWMAFNYHFNNWYQKASAELTYVAPLVTQKVEAAETVESKIEKLKQKLINDMQSCEYPSFNQATAIPVMDDNKSGTLPSKDKLSYGPLQWKISTMQRMYKALHGTELTNYEAILKAMDGKQAREIALDAWLQIKGSINEWSCATEQMKTRVEDIRFLEN